MKRVILGLIAVLGYITVNAATISGTITHFQTDEPLAGVTILLRTGGGQGTTGGDTVGQTTTSADGSYEFTDLEVRRYVVAASLEGYMPGTESVRIWREDDNITSDIALTAADNSGTIAGSITDAETDEAIAGAMVILFYSSGQATGLVPADTAATDQEGSFTFTDVVVALSHVVTAVADGYNEAQSDNINVPAEGSVTVNLSLTEFVPPSGALGGTVTDSETEEPLANALVTLQTGIWRQGQGVTWEDAATQTTDAEGAYLFEGLAPSSDQIRYAIAISLEGYNTYTSYNITIGEDTAQANAALEPVTKGILNVRVTDEADDTPLEGAAVNAALEIPDGPIYSGTTDENGWVSFADALTGNYTITVSLEGYVTETQGRGLSEEENDTAYVLLAAAAGGENRTLFGTVSDPEDNPVADAEITLQAGGMNNILILKASTDENGVYSIPGVPDRYSNVDITVTAEGFEDYSTSVTMTGDSTSLDMTVEPEAVGVEVVSDNNFMLAFDSFNRSLKITGLKNSSRLAIYTVTGVLVESRILESGNQSVPLKRIGSGMILLISLQRTGQEPLPGNFTYRKQEN